MLVDDDLPPNVILTSVVYLKKGNSIWLHTHMDEMGYYYILEGGGIVQDDDDIKIIKHGDLSATDHGHRHSIENKND